MPGVGPQFVHIFTPGQNWQLSTTLLLYNPKRKNAAIVSFEKVLYAEAPSDLNVGDQTLILTYQCLAKHTNITSKSQICWRLQQIQT